MSSSDTGIVISRATKVISPATNKAIDMTSLAAINTGTVITPATSTAIDVASIADVNPGAAINTAAAVNTHHTATRTHRTQHGAVLSAAAANTGTAFCTAAGLAVSAGVETDCPETAAPATKAAL